MIDLNDLRERPEAYQTACRNKGITFDVTEFLKLDSEYRGLRGEVEALRAQQNQFNKELPKLSGDSKTQKLEAMKGVAAKLKDETERLRVLEEKWRADQLRLPSVPLPDVPVGKDAASNVEQSRWGKIKEFSFKPKDHLELGRELDIIDLERGVKIAGARNYFLKGDGARLQHALMNLAMDRIVKKGYLLMDPPHIVKYEAMMGTGYFPGGEEQAYHLDDRDGDLYLIGTSEVSVASYHASEILALNELPKRYAGYSPCYRREAGSYGKDTAGIFRVHQFYKVEQVIICRADPAESLRMHNELLTNAEEIMQELELPYRVMVLSTGDMGQGQVYKHDIEAWIPSRDAYCETHSCSSFYDFQARRLEMRYKNEQGKNIFCYTLNNTLLASSRLVIAILEMFQNADGSVTIPKALRPYMGGQEKITKRPV